MYYIESKNIDNLFMLPTCIDNREIMYSPLRGIAFMVDSGTAHDLMSGDSEYPLVKEIAGKLSSIDYKQLEGVDKYSIKDVSKNLVILLTNSCNLACKYCYAQFEREDGFLSKKKIKNIIDFVFNVQNIVQKPF